MWKCTLELLSNANAVVGRTLGKMEGLTSRYMYWWNIYEFHLANTFNWKGEGWTFSQGQMKKIYTTQKCNERQSIYCSFNYDIRSTNINRASYKNKSRVWTQLTTVGSRQLHPPGAHTSRQPFVSKGELPFCGGSTWAYRCIIFKIHSV